MSAALHHLPQRGREIAELARSIRELAGDDDLAFADTLDGETDALKAASGAARMVGAMEAMAEAAKSLSGRYSARAKDFTDRADRARQALTQFMQEIGEKSLVLPEGTLSLANGSVQMIGEPDIELLPDSLIVTKREPDRAAIKAALLRGESISGVSLSNAKPSLRIRTR